MNSKNRMLYVALITLALLSFVCAPAFGGNATFTGTVTEDNTIEADDGTSYVIAPTEEGDELAGMVGEKVKVTGMVQEQDETMTIDVKDYEVLEE